MLPTNLAELEEIRDECKSMVTKRAAASGAAAAVPLPGVDVAADVAMLLELIPAINRKFGLTPDQIEQLDVTSKTIIYGILKTAGSQMVGKVVTKQIITQVIKKVGARVAVKSVTKFIPFIGQAASAAISFGAMKLVGNSHVDDCYNVARKFLEKQAEVG